MISLVVPVNFTFAQSQTATEGKRTICNTKNSAPIQFAA
jgi:hypothetical protein